LAALVQTASESLPADHPDYDGFADQHLGELKAILDDEGSSYAQ
jgi:hypothetical protein